ncbi:serine/threonine kinase-like domain-containing protein STKLD1 [Sorex fumeus]|uniref:serine/threonine kinase-like domain-containing protein STKLD1 n=1 Tax=Sorex fumeus TaxID=62283 RepID=UPI0024AD5864|nr:serine/threonine kinase-like domain-containing protein STKLD1 [Sorex fumeus]
MAAAGGSARSLTRSLARRSARRRRRPRPLRPPQEVPGRRPRSASAAPAAATPAPALWLTSFPGPAPALLASLSAPSAPLVSLETAPGNMQDKFLRAESGISPEHYQVLQQLPPGALGVNLVVQERGTREKFLIKQVQCMDEHHASQALEELMPLLKLHHAHVSPYRELFIVWDSKISALFLCLVTHWSAETFQTVIDRQRDSRTILEAKWLQEMLGQVLNGLEYLHQAGIIHRNLKPSNIALVSSHRCRLQDLSSQALMTDKAKWTLRADEDPLNRSWMAPEALNFSFTHKSDIWSLGCIILDLVSCSFLGKEEALQLRKAIRNLPESLEGALMAIQERAIPDARTFCTLLPLMLEINPADRIDIREVIHVAFVSGHFHSSTITSTSRQPLPSSTMDTLLLGNMASILELMQNFPGQPDIQLRALKTLLALPEDALGVLWPTVVVDMVARVLKEHEHVPDIQLCGCSLLLHLLGHGLVQDPAAPVPGSGFLVSVLMSLMQHHHEMPLLKQLYDVLTIMASDVVPKGRGSLERAVGLVTKAQTAFPEDLDIAESSCALLWLLAMQGCIKEPEQLTSLFLHCIRLGQDRALLVTNAYRGLACLAKESELTALRLLHDGGLSLLRETYAHSMEDPAVVETLCLLLSHLATHKEVAPELASSGLTPLVQEVKERFTSSLELVAMAEEVLQRLAETQAPHPEHPCGLSPQDGDAPGPPSQRSSTQAAE